MSRIHVPVALRWSDIDAYGHVNNAEMLRVLEEARIRVFWEEDVGAPDVADGMRAQPNLPPQARLAGGPDAPTHTLIAGLQIEYLAPAPFQRRPLDVQLWLGRIGGASLDICYEVCSPYSGPGQSQTVYARAATTLVLVDAETGRPHRLSSAQRDAWGQFVDAPVEFRRR